jgi:hypothetical protein
MDSNRSRTVLVGVAAAAGAFGAAVMMSAATAPAARADDFTDVINSVDFDYSQGQTALTTAFTDFSSSDLASGLAALFSWTNDDGLNAPNDLLVGTVAVLTNESLGPSAPFDFELPTDFSDAITLAESAFTQGANDLMTSAPNYLSFGDYSSAVYEYLSGADFSTIVPIEELLLGAAVSF